MIAGSLAEIRSGFRMQMYDHRVTRQRRARHGCKWWP